MRKISDKIKSLLEQKDKEHKLTYIILWKNWDKIVGAPLANMTKPLGTRKKNLIIGVEDNITMQELIFYQDELLEKINNFFQNQVFDKITFKLLEEKVSLYEIFKKEEEPYTIDIKIPDKLGTLEGKISKTSPVYRAYKKYCEAINEIKNLCRRK